jgi:hypothetical protein
LFQPWEIALVSSAKKEEDIDWSYLLLVGAHLSPSALALLLNSTLGGLGTQVIGNDGAGMLHVQEVGGQRTLGRIGVVRALLALLLLLRGGRGHLGRRHRHENLSSSILEVGEKIRLGTLRGRLAKQKVSLPDKVVCEGAEQLIDGGQATDSLESERVSILRRQTSTYVPNKNEDEGKDELEGRLASYPRQLLTGSTRARSSKLWWSAGQQL